jgi:hypothetical protein
MNKQEKTIFLNILYENKEYLSNYYNDIQDKELYDLYEEFKSNINWSNEILIEGKEEKRKSDRFKEQIKTYTNQVKDIDEKIKVEVDNKKKAEDAISKLVKGAPSKEFPKTLPDYIVSYNKSEKMLNGTGGSFKDVEKFKKARSKNLAKRTRQQNSDHLLSIKDYTVITENIYKDVCELSNNELLNINFILECVVETKDIVNINSLNDVMKRFYCIYENVNNKNIDDFSKKFLSEEDGSESDNTPEEETSDDDEEPEDEVDLGNSTLYSKKDELLNKISDTEEKLANLPTLKKSIAKHLKSGLWSGLTKGLPNVLKAITIGLVAKTIMLGNV